MAAQHSHYLNLLAQAVRGHACLPVLKQREEQLQVGIAEGGIDGHKLGEGQQRRGPQRLMRPPQLPGGNTGQTRTHADCLQTFCFVTSQYFGLQLILLV